MSKVSRFLIFMAVAVSACGNSQSKDTELLISNNELGNWEVFVLVPDSPILHQVTHEAPHRPTPQSFVEGLDLEATWSPSGDRIALSSDRRDGYHLYVVDVNGVEQAQLTNKGEGSNGEPAWSPDGSQIAFRSDRTGDVELFVMDVDGSNLRQLTQSPGEDWTPTWSPDGSRIAFASRRYNGTWDIFSILPDGTGISQLTSDEWDNWLPDWSPDGTQIAYSSNREGNWDIFTMDLDGGSVLQVTDNTARDLEPVWSPDGTQLSFASARGEPVGLKVFFVDLESGEVSESGSPGFPTAWR